MKTSGDLLLFREKGATEANVADHKVKGALGEGLPRLGEGGGALHQLRGGGKHLAYEREKARVIIRHENAFDLHQRTAGWRGRR